MRQKGFTLIELLVVISIIIILSVAAIPVYGNLQVSAQLNENTSQIIQAIRTARERSVAGYNNRQHGVYFNINASSDNKYILYQGSSYATREAGYDRETILGSSLSISANDFTFTGSDVDINFSKGLGVPDNTGTIILTHDVSGTRSIILNDLGIVEED